MTTHQDCGDVIYLILVERCRACMSTLDTKAILAHLVRTTIVEHNGQFYFLCSLPWNTGQLNSSVSMNFTLHTELRASVPEFTISCRTHGGPATTVQWTVNGVPVQEDRYHETSQLILDTSLNSVYGSRLRVSGRRNGTYDCTIRNNIRHFIPEASIDEVNETKIITGSYKSSIQHFVHGTYLLSGRRAHRCYCSHL